MKRLLLPLLLSVLPEFSITHSCEAADLRIAKFDIDVTPPIGFTMAYDDVKRIEELGLRCRGVVILGAGRPIALCAVDWIGIGNGAYEAFRDSIAEAAGTEPERVAVHTLHQHDAPRCDFTTEQILLDSGVTDARAFNSRFARECLRGLRAAIRNAVADTQPLTHFAVGEATVEKVASNRRIQDDTGRVIATRYTTCRDAELRALPAGIIDPVLTSITLYHKTTPVAVLTYYACHPQSYYRTGVPSPDFPGIARFLRGQDVPNCLHVHFNGAGGNIGAGKYNDGNQQNRTLLATRVAAAMKDAFESAARQPLSADQVGWAVSPVSLPLGDHLNVSELEQQLANWDGKAYWNAAEQLAWARRCQAGDTIDLSCLKLGSCRILHMPGELFVEYQLAAKALRPSLTIAMAAYGDYGPGYIGTDAAYGQGGYETSARASKVGPGVEVVLMNGVRELLSATDPLPPADDGDDAKPNAASSPDTASANSAPDLQERLPRIPPTEPDNALSKFHIHDDFEVDLVACEPLIGTPVAIEWDADGRMFVCEMRGYSEQRDERISSIALLEDADGDGRYDTRYEYASGLAWFLVAWLMLSQWI